MDLNLEISHTNHELWVDEIEKIFIEMLCFDALTGALRVGKITNRDHASYAEHLTTLGIRAYDANQVNGKIHWLKMMQRFSTDLMSQTGMGWDPDTKTVIGSDEHWANAIRVKLQVKRFRT